MGGWEEDDLPKHIGDIEGYRGADDRAARGLPLRGGQDMGEARHPDLDGEDRRGDPEGDAEAAPDEEMAARPSDLFGKGGIRPAGARGRAGEPGGSNGLHDQDPQQDGAGVDPAPEDGEIRKDDAEEPGGGGSDDEG